MKNVRKFKSFLNTPRGTGPENFDFLIVFRYIQRNQKKVCCFQSTFLKYQPTGLLGLLEKVCKQVWSYVQGTIIKLVLKELIDNIDLNKVILIFYSSMVQLPISYHTSKIHFNVFYIINLLFQYHMVWSGITSSASGRGGTIRIFYSLNMKTWKRYKPKACRFSNQNYKVLS